MDMEGWPFESTWGLRRIPELTARYEVLRRIGGGNYGDVFQGRRRKDNLIVALKEIHDMQSSKRELDALLRLDNPNIVKLLEYFKKGSNVVLVLEYAPSNLADVIASGPLGEAVIKGIMLQILQGLAACHSTSIVHRDLKPSNILLTADGLLKIADFGNARIIKEQCQDSIAKQGLARAMPVSLATTENTGCGISEEVLREKNSEDTSVIEESPTSSADGVVNVNYFLQQEKDVASDGIEQFSQKGYEQALHVKGTAGKGLAGQKQSDFFQKLKGFLKKSNPHSQKHGQVTEFEGSGAQSWLGSSNDGDSSEYRQRSGRWISPVNSQLFVFDNKENQAQDQGITSHNHSNLSVSQEKVECLSERWEKEALVGLQSDKSTTYVHSASQTGSFRAEGRSSLKDLPAPIKQAEQTVEHSNPVEQVEFDSGLACSSQLQRADSAQYNLLKEDTSYISESLVGGMMENQQLVEDILQDTDPNRDIVVPSQSGKVTTFKGGEKQLHPLVVDEPNKETLPDDEVLCTESMPTIAVCMTDPELLMGKETTASQVAEVANGGLTDEQSVGTAVTNLLEKRTSETEASVRAWSTKVCQDELNLPAEELRCAAQSCESDPISRSEAHTVDSMPHSHAKAVFEPLREMQVLHPSLQSRQRTSGTHDVARVDGFFPKNECMNSPLRVSKWTDPTTVCEGFGIASGTKRMESTDRPSSVSYSYGPQSGRSKRTNKTMSSEHTTSLESNSLSPLYTGKSPDENLASSFENWDRSVHEARRNLEQGGGVYGLYQHRGGWQGYNGDLKCWGVITSKGKIVGQNLSQEGNSSRIPRIRADKARASSEKAGQRVSFLNGEGVDLGTRKYPESNPLSAPERARYLRTLLPQSSIASDVRGDKSDWEVGTSSSSPQRHMKIPPRRNSRSFFAGRDSMSNQRCDLDLQCGSGWISPSDRFNIIPATVASYDNEMGLCTTDFDYPGQHRLEVEGRMGSESGSPSEKFDFMRVRPQSLQTESKSSLSDVSNIDVSDPSLQLTTDAGLKNWSDIEKESESGHDGWDKASGEWSIDKDGFSGELEGSHPASLERPGETRWFGAPEVKDSYLEIGHRSYGTRALSPQQTPWNQSREHEQCLEDPNKGKGLVSEVNILELSNKEQDWDNSVRAGGYDSPAEELSAEFSDRSFSRSGSQDSDTDFTGCVGSRWYKSPEILYGATKYGRAIDLWAVGLIFAELLKGEPLFPGLNDIDQLSRIVRFLGSATESCWPGVSELPDYDKIFFLDDRQPLSLDDEFPTASKACLRFLRKFLVYNPAERLNAKEALDDVFFSADPAPAPPCDITIPTHRRKDSNFEEWGDWREQESSSLSDFELLS